MLGVTFASQVEAQFSVNGQYMSRGEYRHGLGTLADTNQSGAMFISQRARLGAEFKHEKFKMNVAVQDVRTWGSVANSAIDTKGLLSIYEANVELLMSKKWALKVGRQAISYDDDRIFGTLDWSMQGRRHDAAILKYRDSTWSGDAGFAFNQNAESYKLAQYTVNNYKNFQYLWVNKKIGKGNYSFLFLNNGVAYNKLNSSIPLCKPKDNSDLKILNLVEDNLDLLIKTFNKYEIHNYLKNIIQLCSEVNKYVNDSAPWSLKDDNLEKRNIIIYTVLEFIRKISILLQPIIPGKTNIILDSLNVKEDERFIKNINKNFSIKPETKIQKINILFKKQ